MVDVVVVVTGQMLILANSAGPPKAKMWQIEFGEFCCRSTKQKAERKMYIIVHIAVFWLSLMLEDRLH